MSTSRPCRVFASLALMLAACSSSSTPGTAASSASSSTGSTSTAGSTSASAASSTSTTTGGSSTGNNTASSTGTSSNTTGSTSTGTSSGSTGTTGVGFTSAHDRCLQQAEAACEHNAACGVLASADLALCEATFACDDGAIEAVQDEQVDAGLADVDAVALGGCVSDIGAAPCTVTGAQAVHASTNCAIISRGAAGTGASCLVASDCQPDFTCLRSSSACGGTCQPWLTTGPCGLGHPALAVGYSCDDTGNTAAQLGQGSTCTADNQCLAPYQCAGITGARTCDVPGAGAQGDGCSGAHGCGPSLACVNSNSDAGFCWPRVGAGGSCNAIFSDGGINLTRDGGPRPNNALCLDDVFCDPTATCAANALLGEACALDGTNPHCIEGACVNPGSGGGVCAFQSSGAFCTRAADCLSAACVATGDGGGICGDLCP